VRCHDLPPGHWATARRAPARGRRISLFGWPGAFGCCGAASGRAAGPALEARWRDGLTCTCTRMLA